MNFKIYVVPILVLFSFTRDENIYAQQVIDTALARKITVSGFCLCKTTLADLVVKKLLEIQEKYHKIRSNEASLRKILDAGRDFAIEKSDITLQSVKEKVGLI